MDHGGQGQLLDDRFQEAAALGHGIDQVDPRAATALEQDRQHDPREAGAGPEVGPGLGLRLQWQQLGPVEGMAPPEGLHG